MTVPHLFNRSLVKLHRNRAVQYVNQWQEIAYQCSERFLKRLEDIKRPFELALEMGGRGVVAPYLMSCGIDVISVDLSVDLAVMNNNKVICMDEEFLAFKEQSFDLVIANFNLHWVNDLPGTLLQIRKILRPDGLFLASIPILPTLSLLRTVMTEIEIEQYGHVSPRVSPLPDLRSCATLMQRAGFALPTIDKERIEFSYRSSLGLLKDLRWAGETNALQEHQHYFEKKSFLVECLTRLQKDEPIKIDLHFAVLTGWGPDASQPQPLKPGQFDMTLEEVLQKQS